ncbi:hypothetical protein LC040_06270 [Bacillus tianshenii]|nr:hypothetical protein LC040_06270 [Bacillus tianshenii]
MVKFPESIPMEMLLAKSLEQSISFVPGSICNPGKGSNEWIRLSYSFLNEQKLSEGMKKLISIAEELC